MNPWRAIPGGLLITAIIILVTLLHWWLWIGVAIVAFVALGALSAVCEWYSDKTHDWDRRRQRRRADRASQGEGDKHGTV